MAKIQQSTSSAVSASTTGFDQFCMMKNNQYGMCHGFELTNKTIIFKSLLTTFEASFFWGSSVN